MILKILKKMKHKYGGRWSSHLTDTGFSSFSLIYGTELTVPTPSVVLEKIQGDANDTHTKERLVDME